MATRKQPPELTLVDDGVAPDAEAEAIAGSFRPNLKPALFAVGANLLLAVVCLGVPYWRGQAQARQSLAAFGDFARCLLGAEAGNAAGLGLPAGDMDHFAGRYIRAQADWPIGCSDALDRVAPEEAVFLWPSVKQAGADVRTLIGMMKKELVKTADSRTTPAGRVPTRPILVLSQLRGGLTLLAKAADTDEQLNADAVVFAGPPASPKPSLLPLYAGQSAALQLSAKPNGLEAVAVDGRGISWLRLEDGELDRRRITRPGLVRGVIHAASDASLHAVWAMSEERCKDEQDRCVKRATGISGFDAGAEELPKPIWLAAHPAGRVDRVVRMPDPHHVGLIARGDAEGHVIFKSFELPLQALEDKPLTAERLIEQQAPGPALDSALVGSPVQLLYVTAEDAGVTGHLRRLTAAEPEAPAKVDGQSANSEAGGQGGAPGADEQTATATTSRPEHRSLPPLAGEKGWVAGCADEWFVVGSERALQVGRLDGNEIATAELGCEEPVHVDDPGRDGVRLFCDAKELRLLCRQGDELKRVRCTATQCDAPETLANGVSVFDAVEIESGSYVAFSGDWEHAQIRVLPLKDHAEPVVPAGCWDPRGGLCGVPTLFSDGKRLLVGAREGSDLLVVESRDGARTWQPLSGMQNTDSLVGDPNAAMEQHKKRKGLD